MASLRFASRASSLFLPYFLLASDDGLLRLGQVLLGFEQPEHRVDLRLDRRDS
jgi:hypothetical protein